MEQSNKLEDKVQGDILISQDEIFGNAAAAEERLLKTPSKKNGKQIQMKTPCSGSTKKLPNGTETPRRSARKSNKPLLDYEEIICNSATKSLTSIAEQFKKSNVAVSVEESTQQKWTIAEVGRDRHKRSRRSRRNSKVRTKSQSDNEDSEYIVKLAEVELSPVKEEKDKQQLDENNEVQPLYELPAKQEANKSAEEHKFDMLSETNEKPLKEQRQKDDVIDLTTPLKHTNNAESMKSFGSHLKPSDVEMEDLGLNALHEESENSIDINTNEKETDETIIILKLSADSQTNDNIYEISEDEDDDKENVQPTSIDLESLSPITSNDLENSISSNAAESQMHFDTNANSNNIQPTDTSSNVLKEISGFEVSCCNHLDSTHITTIMEKEQIILRGIRKRSLSICIGESRAKIQSQILKEPPTRMKTKKSVKFYSPANEMTVINDLDLQIAEAVKVATLPKDSMQINEGFARGSKRSLSMDDIANKSRIPRPKLFKVNNITPNKKTPLQELPQSKEKFVRSKLPNFAAIHERQFQKMENLMEYVNRKQERSKNLLNSNGKTSGSAHKLHNKGIGTNSTKVQELKERHKERPKSQKLLQMSSSTPKKLLTATVKPMTCNKPVMNAQSNTSMAAVDSAQKLYKSPYKPIKLGTNIQSDNKIKANISKNNAMEDKAAERLQRHMDLFKGRRRSISKSKIKDQREKESYIRGVRSNRRFELLMNHRRNMEK